MPKHNPNKLTYSYSKREEDFLCHYPRKCDWALMFHLFWDILEWDFTKHTYPPYERFNVIKELEKRWYDLKTLKFSIELKNNL